MLLVVVVVVVVVVVGILWSFEVIPHTGDLFEILCSEFLCV